MQRREYYDQRELAAMFPDKYMCLIIDGSDQDTSRLPHLSVSRDVATSPFLSVSRPGLWPLRPT